MEKDDGGPAERIDGELFSVEFVHEGTKAHDDDRLDGTYVTIRVDDGHLWSGGSVVIERPMLLARTQSKDSPEGTSE